MNFLGNRFLLLALALLSTTLLDSTEAFAGLTGEGGIGGEGGVGGGEGGGAAGGGEGFQYAKFLCGQEETLPIVQTGCNFALSYLQTTLEDVIGPADGGDDDGAADDDDDDARKLLENERPVLRGGKQ